LKNAQKAIKEFKKEYKQNMENVAQQECEEEVFQQRELPGRFIAKKLYRWLDRRYDQHLKHFTFFAFFYYLIFFFSFPYYIILLVNTFYLS